MIEFFHTLSSYWDKLVSLFDTIFTYVKDSVTEVNVWLTYFPSAIITASGIILVVLVIYKILGRS